MIYAKTKKKTHTQKIPKAIPFKHLTTALLWPETLTPEYFPNKDRYLWFCDEYVGPNSHTLSQSKNDPYEPTRAP